MGKKKAALSLWQEAFDYIDVPVLVYDASAWVVRANLAAMRFHGNIMEEMKDLFFYQWLHQHIETSAPVHLPDHLPAGKTMFEDVYHANSDQWFAISFQAFASEVDGAWYGVMQIQDITESKKHKTHLTHRLSFLQSMDAMSNVLDGAAVDSTRLHRMLKILSGIFNVQRVLLLRAPECDVLKFELIAEYFIEPSCSLLDDSIDIRHHMQALGYEQWPTGVQVHEGVGSGFAQSQMVVPIVGKVGAPWLLLVQQCTVLHHWTHDEQRLYAAIGQRFADVLDNFCLNDALSQRSDQYRQLVDHLPIGCMVLVDERVHLMNQSLLDCLAIDDLKAVYGNHFADFMSAAAWQRLGDKLAHQQGVLDRYAMRLVSRHGESIDVLLTSRPIRSHGRDALQFLIEDVGESLRKDHDLRQALEQNEQMMKRLIKMQERLSRDLALDLHDQSGQVLTALSTHLSLLAKHLDAQGMQHLQTCNQLMQELFTSMHRAVKSLNPTHIYSLGLVEALKGDILDWSGHYGIELESSFDDRVNDLNDTQATVVFRIVQESLTNIARHAHATSVQLDLHLDDDDTVFLTIVDNGCGFCVAEVCGDRFGLFGMRSRAEQVAGQLSIKSSEQGTEIQLRFPLYFSQES